MSDLDLPPEILAKAFEIGLYDVGIRFLVPVTLVCKHWNNIVETTPRLWGIIAPKNYSDTLTIHAQITKAKAAPLSLQLLNNTRAVNYEVMARLVALSKNWAEASLTTDQISKCKWSDLTNLEALTLVPGDNWVADATTFFDEERRPKFRTGTGKLTSFNAISLPDVWTHNFLSRTLRHFYLRRGHTSETTRYTHNILDTFKYLSLITGAYTIELESLPHTDPKNPPPITRYTDLQDLSLKSVRYSRSVLNAISAPSLRLLVVHDDEGTHTTHIPWQAQSINRDLVSLAPFFSQWSQPEHLPNNLHTLELVDCLSPSDVPFLIRWLYRLPNLIRLLLQDDDIKEAALIRDSPDETNLYRALSTQSATGNYLCPKLTILRLDTDQDVEDLLPIAALRNGDHPGISRLHRIESPLCVAGSQPEIDRLTSLVSQAHCIGFCCTLKISMNVRET